MANLIPCPDCGRTWTMKTLSWRMHTYECCLCGNVESEPPQCPDCGHEGFIQRRCPSCQCNKQRVWP